MPPRSVSFRPHTSLYQRELLQSSNGRMLSKSIISWCFCWMVANLDSVSGQLPRDFPPVKLPLSNYDRARTRSYPYDATVALFDSWPSVKCPSAVHIARTTATALTQVLPETREFHTTNGVKSETGYGVIDQTLQDKSLIIKYKKYSSARLKKGHYILLGVWELVCFQLFFLQKTDLLARSSK